MVETATNISTQNHQLTPQPLYKYLKRLIPLLSDVKHTHKVHTEACQLLLSSTTNDN